MNGTFDDIREGDAVALRSWNGWSGRTEKATVTRVLPASFEVGGKRFRKEDGRCIPKERYSPSALIWSDEVEQQMREEQSQLEHTRTVNALGRVSWGCVNREAVAAVHAILVTAGAIEPIS